MKMSTATMNKNIDLAVDRRGFIKRSAASISLTLLASQQAVAESFSKRPDRHGVLVDMTRCIGCCRCENSCAITNNLHTPKTLSADNGIFEKKRKLGAQAFTVVNRYSNEQRMGEPVYRKSQCMHCDEPACVSACLAGAFKKTPEGPVIWDEKRCIGCRYCMNACPFYIPAYEYTSALTPKIQKCFMCYHQRIIKGQIPACVAECPVEALTFGKRSDVIKAARERIRTHADKYVESIYGEHEAGGTSWIYIGPMAFDKTDLPADIGTTPMPTYTRDFLSFVPLVLAVWPPLLGALHLLCKRNKKNDIQAPESLEKDQPSL
jgi:formate dehydrogenase iron-sulfur subunit